MKMLLKVFCLYDSKVEAYSRPFYAVSRGEALRAFMELLNDERSSPSKYPQDFTLFELGSYDDSRGAFENLPAPVSVGNGIEYRSVGGRPANGPPQTDIRDFINKASV